MLFNTVQTKLHREASKANLNLRMLVSHANLLDSLSKDITENHYYDSDDEEEDERFADEICQDSDSDSEDFEQIESVSVINDSKSYLVQGARPLEPIAEVSIIELEDEEEEDEKETDDDDDEESDYDYEDIDDFEIDESQYEFMPMLTPMKDRKSTLAYTNHSVEFLAVH